MSRLGAVLYAPVVVGGFGRLITRNSWRYPIYRVPRHYMQGLSEGRLVGAPKLRKGAEHLSDTLTKPALLLISRAAVAHYGPPFICSYSDASSLRQPRFPRRLI